MNGKDVVGRFDDVCLPRSVKYHKESKRILIADAGNCRIIAVSTDLDNPRLVHQWKDIKMLENKRDETYDDFQPMRIVMNEENNILFVGMESSRIEMYDNVYHSRFQHF